MLQIKTVQFSMQADDGQLHTTDTDLVSLEEHISREVNSENAWYEINRMIVNPSKCQGILLGNTEHHFNFSMNDSMHLFGVTSDKDLSLKQHVTVLYMQKSKQSVQCYD